METSEIIAIVTLCVAFVALAAIVGVTVYGALRSRRSFFFNVHSHEVVVRVRAAGVTLLVDGREEDVFSAQNIYAATLRAQIDGEEFKAQMTRSTFNCSVTATHGGREVLCVNVSK